jgi:hypothetical protein
MMEEKYDGTEGMYGQGLIWNKEEDCVNFKRSSTGMANIGDVDVEEIRIGLHDEVIQVRRKEKEGKTSITTVNPICCCCCYHLQIIQHGPN